MTVSIEQAEAARGRGRDVKSSDAFRTISEVSEELGVPQHVLRFWETRFSQVRPMKRGGGRRYYRPADIELLKRIHHLLYAEGYTIKGVQKLLKGAKSAASATGSVDEKVGPPPNAAKAPALSDRQRKSLESALTELKSLRAQLS